MTATILERGGTYLVTDGGDSGVIVDKGKARPVKVQAALALGFWRPFTGDPYPILKTAGLKPTTPVRSRAQFDPAKHPHRPKGSGGGQWAATPEPNQPRGPQYAPKPHGYHPARLAIDAPEFDDLAQRFAKTLPTEFQNQGDDALREIVRLQGFDGLPTVVDEAQLPIHRWDDQGFTTSEGDGSVELWRGVSADASGTAAQYAEQFRSGDYRAGQGLYGNGIYAGGRMLAKVYASNDEWGAHTDDYQAGLIHLALKPKARIVDAVDPDFRRDHANAAKGTPLWNDAGRYAAARGFDAIRLPEGNYVILNRTAVVVAR